MKHHDVLRVLAVLFAVSGCGNEPSVASEDVIRISVCNADGTCNGTTSGFGIADGQTAIAIRVSTPTKDHRRLNIPVLVSTTDGYFDGPDKSSKAAVNVGASKEETLRLIPGTTVGEVLIRAESFGYSTTGHLMLAAAPLTAITVVPNPIIVPAATTSSVQLAVCVHGPGTGKPSRGTRVSFEVTSAGGSGSPNALIYPQELVIEGPCDAKPMLSTLPGPENVVLSVTATPPDSDAGSAEPTTVELQIIRIPDPAQTEKDGG